MLKTWLRLKINTLLKRNFLSLKFFIHLSNIRKLILLVAKHWRKMASLSQTLRIKLTSWTITSTLFSHSKYQWNSLLFVYIFSSIFQNNENDMPEIHVTENGVLKLLKALNISKVVARWYQTKSTQRIILRISTYPYSAFQGIFASTISSRHLETCQW